MRLVGNWMGRVCVTIAVAAVAGCLTAAPLPEAALKRAQQAEKKLEANKPKEAIDILVKVDKDYPNHAAVSLRLGQIYDKMNDLGGALYYYRRYAKLAEGRQLEEATARLYTLELMPNAVKAANDLSKKNKDNVAPVAVPPPTEQKTLVKVNPDGSKTRLSSLEDLSKTTADEPATATQSSKAIVIPELQGAKAAPTKAPARLAAAGPTRTPTSAKFTPPVSVPVSKQVAATPTAEATVAPEPPAIEATPIPTAQPPAVSGKGQSPIYVAVAERPKPTAAPVATDFPVSTPRPQETPRRMSAAASDFFKENAYKGNSAAIKLSNELTDAIVTFTAAPPMGDPTNVILVQGEKRTIALPPGEFSIVATVATTNYPPATLQDRRFDIEFAAGKVYTHAFTQESLQSGNR